MENYEVRLSLEEEKSTVNCFSILEANTQRQWFSMHLFY